MNKSNRNKRLMWQLPFLAFLIIGTILIISGQKQVPYQHCRGFVFGTSYSMTYQCDSDLTRQIEAELQKVDNSLSTFNDKSCISAVNRGENVEVDDMFREVFMLAEQVSKETDGAFDITVAPLVNAWGFGFKHGTPPTKHSIDSMLCLIGHDKVSISGNRVRKSDPRIMLDCSAIAKGYGSDVVARLFRSKGITNFMVEIGGEIVASGINEKRVPWKIGVTKPVEDSLSTSGEIQTVLNVTDKAMATSGNYRNFYYKNGKKYAHTIDPKTGYPIQHNILSSTVIAENCATADAYATAFMVLGLDKAKKVLERHPELMAYFIYSDRNGKNAVWFSPSMKDKIQP